MLSDGYATRNQIVRIAFPFIRLRASLESLWSSTAGSSVLAVEGDPKHFGRNRY